MPVLFNTFGTLFHGEECKTWNIEKVDGATREKKRVAAFVLRSESMQDLFTFMQDLRGFIFIHGKHTIYWCSDLHKKYLFYASLITTNAMWIMNAAFHLQLSFDRFVIIESVFLSLLATKLQEFI